MRGLHRLPNSTHAAPSVVAMPAAMDNPNANPTSPLATYVGSISNVEQREVLIRKFLIPPSEFSTYHVCCVEMPSALQKAQKTQQLGGMAW